MWSARRTGSRPTGQLAAASSPPRFSSSFRSNRFHYSTRVSCDLQPSCAQFTYIREVDRTPVPRRCGVPRAGQSARRPVACSNARGSAPPMRRQFSGSKHELGRRFAQTADALTARAARVRAIPTRSPPRSRDTAAARTLFQSLAAELGRPFDRQRRPHRSTARAATRSRGQVGCPTCRATASTVRRCFSSLSIRSGRGWSASTRSPIRPAPRVRAWPRSSPSNSSSNGPMWRRRCPTRSACRPRSSTSTSAPRPASPRRNRPSRFR